MKVALLVHRFHPDIGGVEMTAEILARGWAVRYGDEVTVITHTTEHDPTVGFPFTVLRGPRRRDLWRAIKGADVVFHNNPCMQLYWPQIPLRPPCVIAIRQWITQADEELSLTQRLKMGLKYSLVEQADIVVANSRATFDHVAGVDRVIPNSYRDRVFTWTRTAPRDRRRHIYVGRINLEHKGVDMLVEAVRRLAERGLDPSLVVVGDGEAQPEMERLVREAGIVDRVRFTGRLDGPATAAELNEAAIAVVPSRQPETFGTVALEAAACGAVPVVADHGGLPEAAGPAGPHVRPNDVDALTDELARLMTDEDYYAGYASAIPAHVAQHHEDRMVDAYHEVLERAVSGGSRRGARGTMRRLLRFLRSGRWTVTSPSR